MAHVLYDGLRFCEPCTFVALYGEYSDGKDTAERCSAAIAAKWGADGVHLVHDSSEEDVFSTVACDGCGDPCHGTRHGFAVLVEDMPDGPDAFVLTVDGVVSPLPVGLGEAQAVGRARWYAARGRAVTLGVHRGARADGRWVPTLVDVGAWTGVAV